MLKHVVTPVHVATDRRTSPKLRMQVMSDVYEPQHVGWLGRTRARLCRCGRDARDLDRGSIRLRGLVSKIRFQRLRHTPPRHVAPP